MKTLQFKVSGQTLNVIDIPMDLVKGTRNYLQCAFSFDGAEWSGCKVVAEFGDGRAVPIIQTSLRLSNISSCVSSVFEAITESLPIT